MSKLDLSDAFRQILVRPEDLGAARIHVAH